jgi:hypothetical protein
MTQLVSPRWKDSVFATNPSCQFQETNTANSANLYEEPDAVTRVVVPAHTMTAGSSVQLATASYDAGNSQLWGLIPYTYADNNTSVATVSSTGLVTAVKAGTALITATQPWSYPGQSNVNGSATMTVTPVGSISGPITISTAGSYTWTVSASGCNTTCTYQWQEIQVNVSGGWFNTSGTTSHNQNVQAAYGDFELQVIITSNGQSYTTPSIYVTNNIGGGGGCNPIC